MPYETHLKASVPAAPTGEERFLPSPVLVWQSKWQRLGMIGQNSLLSCPKLISKLPTQTVKVVEESGARVLDASCEALPGSLLFVVKAPVLDEQYRFVYFNIKYLILSSLSSSGTLLLP